MWNANAEFWKGPRIQDCKRVAWAGLCRFLVDACFFANVLLRQMKWRKDWLVSLLSDIFALGLVNKCFFLAGDQSPPQYPVITIHVPERATLFGVPTCFG